MVKQKVASVTKTAMPRDLMRHVHASSANSSTTTSPMRAVMPVYLVPALSPANNPATTAAFECDHTLPWAVGNIMLAARQHHAGRQQRAKAKRRRDHVHALEPAVHHHPRGQGDAHGGDHRTRSAALPGHIGVGHPHQGTSGQHTHPALPASTLIQRAMRVALPTICQGSVPPM